MTALITTASPPLPVKRPRIAMITNAMIAIRGRKVDSMVSIPGLAGFLLLPGGHPDNVL